MTNDTTAIRSWTQPLTEETIQSMCEEIDNLRALVREGIGHVEQGVGVVYDADLPGRTLMGKWRLKALHVLGEQ